MINRGKDFEKVIKEAFEKVPNTSVVRLHDQTNGFAGSTNPCDFLIYHRPYMYAIECKSVHGNTLPFSNITNFQWQSLLDMSKVKGVFAGIICWWIDRDVTLFIPISELQKLKDCGHKSVPVIGNSPINMPIHYKTGWTKLECGYKRNYCEIDVFEIKGKKKRVFFDYDMEQFFNETRIAYEMDNQSEIPRRSGIWPK